MKKYSVLILASILNTACVSSHQQSTQTVSDSKQTNKVQESSVLNDDKSKPSTTGPCYLSPPIKDYDKLLKMLINAGEIDGKASYESQRVQLDAYLQRKQQGRKSCKK
ncbi:hypothetical protein MHM98_09210 [Psychrobium sp. MM17-31]|uniref:hypothetical protein n=1 Tax=Psychrobium sp. MM17-31 TaxID=2917758 RepID=UPI001EF5FD8A|nr:hypothetical protein [Psychrobium sp. MM17-31]MCG7531516.1 hypothetical protein [Psychrobium sp. MM17-31]